MSWRPSLALLVTVIAAAGLAAGCRGSDAAGDYGSPVASSAPSVGAAPPGNDIGEAEPVRLRIPAIGVDATFQRLDPDPTTGELPPPTNNDDVGWWGGGPEPGEPGTAVAAGHVDSYQGPAVLFRLHELQPGETISIDTADGDAVTFKVNSVERFSKTAFPTDRVYERGNATPALALVTCGGAFDRTARSYEDNVIAFATLVQP